MTSEGPPAASATGRQALVPEWLIEALKGERGSEAVMVFVALSLEANYAEDPDMLSAVEAAGMVGLSVEQVERAIERLREVGALVEVGPGDFVIQTAHPSRRTA